MSRSKKITQAAMNVVDGAISITTKQIEGREVKVTIFPFIEPKRSKSSRDCRHHRKSGKQAMSLDSRDQYSYWIDTDEDPITTPYFKSGL